MIVLPDRVVDDGYVLVGDGLVQAIGTGQIPAGERYGGLDLSCSRVRLIRKSTAAARRARRILSMAASAQVPSPDMAAKAKELKEADNNYVKVLCHGPKTQLADAKSVRDRLQSDLGKAIADADAGEGADKIATSGSASDQDKAEAAAKFQKAKSDLREALAAERGKLEDQLAKNPGVTLAAKESCPDTSNPAASRNDKTQAAPRQITPSGTVVAPAISIGPGGIGIGIGIGH